jgi:hypothetical protein
VTPPNLDDGSVPAGCQCATMTSLSCDDASAPQWHPWVATMTSACYNDDIKNLKWLQADPAEKLPLKFIYLCFCFCYISFGCFFGGCFCREEKGRKFVTDT